VYGFPDFDLPLQVSLCVLLTAGSGTTRGGEGAFWEHDSSHFILRSVTAVLPDGWAGAVGTLASPAGSAASPPWDSCGSLAWTLWLGGTALLSLGRYNNLSSAEKP